MGTHKAQRQRNQKKMGEGDKKKLDNKRKQYLKSKLLDFAKKCQEEIVEEIKQKKEKVISERLPVLPNLGDMSEEQIRQLCRELHAQTDKTDDTRYDLEQKSNKLSKEIGDLNPRITQIKDKFQKPALKRVRISADQMLKTLLGSKGKATQIDMRQNLKKKPEKKEGEKA